MLQFPQRIKAQAIVDPGAFDVVNRIRDQPFLVTVMGEMEGGDALENRVYEIAAEDEAHAAFAGIERYITEMDRVN